MNGRGSLLVRRGMGALVRLAVSPVSVLLTTPLRLAQGLWAARVLTDGRGDYTHFNPVLGLSALFYRTAAVSLKRFGFSGKSPSLLPEGFPLSRWFHYTPLSLNLFCRRGAATLLLGMGGWLVAHAAAWSGETPGAWIFFTLAAALMSTTFYENLFGVQNYNVLGWAFFPFGVHGLMTGWWVEAGVAWLLVGSCSFTGAFLGALASAVAAALWWDTDALWIAGGAAALAMAVRFWPATRMKGGLRAAVVNIAKAIGMMDRGVRYKFLHTKKLDLKTAYHFLLSAQFTIVCVWAGGEAPWLVLLSAVLSVVNAAWVRFADGQSLTMMSFSAVTAQLLAAPSWPLAVSYVLMVNPFPKLTLLSAVAPVWDVVPRVRPFDVRGLMEDMSAFLAPVPSSGRVLAAFDDPLGIYENLFDGYRVLNEPLLCEAVGRNIGFFPNWWMLAEQNRMDSPAYWGRDLPSLRKNAAALGAGFILFYQEEGQTEDPAWRREGWEVASVFHWGPRLREWPRVLPEGLPVVDWWLLKIGGSPCVA